MTERNLSNGRNKNVHQKKLGYYFLKKLYAKNKKRGSTKRADGDDEAWCGGEEAWCGGGWTARARRVLDPRRDAFPCGEVVERGGDRGDGRGGGGATGRQLARQLDGESEGGVTPSGPPRSR